jgi:hypothetical protein
MHCYFNPMPKSTTPKARPPHELLAELTWAKLYSKRIQDESNVLFAALRKAQDLKEEEESSDGLDMIESATLLREHLRLANIAIGELSSRARIKHRKRK